MSKLDYALALLAQAEYEGGFRATRIVRDNGDILRLEPGHGSDTRWSRLRRGEGRKNAPCIKALAK